jgi:hypothetical protein
MSWYSSLGLVSGERCVVKPGSRRIAPSSPLLSEYQVEGGNPARFWRIIFGMESLG